MVQSQLKLDGLLRVALIAAFFLPLIYTPGVLYPYQYGKVLLFEAIIGLAFAAALFLKKDFAVRKSPIFWALLIFLAVRLITGFAGDNPEKSFWGDHIRMTGTVLFLFLFFFFLLVRKLFGEKEGERKLLKIVCVSGALGALLGLVQHFTNIGRRVLGGSDEWLFGSFGNPSYFAGYLVLIIFFTALLIARESVNKKRIIWGAIVLAEVIMLFATSARGAIVGLLLGVAVFGLVLIILSGRPMLRAAGTAGVILPVVFLVSSLLIYFGPGRESAPGRVLGSLLRAGTAETRLINWRIALDGWRAKPIFGWGPENYEIIFSKFYRPELIKYSYGETWSDRPHNIVLEIADGSGVVGLLAFAALLGIPIWVLLRRKFPTSNSSILFQLPAIERAILAGGIAAYFGQALFLFDTFSTLLLLATLLAIIDRSNMTNETYRFYQMPRIVDKLLAVGLGVFILFGVVLPTRASHYAERVEYDILSRNFVQLEKDFRRALAAPTPHHDDIAKILADDIIKGDAAGRVPKEVTVSLLPDITAYLERAANNHQNVFGLTVRSAQLFSLAGEYIDPAYFKKSEEMFDLVQALSPHRQTALISRAQMEIARGNYDKAVDISRALLDTSADFSDAYWLHGLALVAAGREEQAEEVFDKMVLHGRFNFAASNSEALLRKTSLVLDFYANRGKFDKMVSTLEWLSLSYPKYIPVHMRLAGVYASLGKFEEARAEALKIIFLDPHKRQEIEEFIEAIDVLLRSNQ